VDQFYDVLNLGLDNEYKRFMKVLGEFEEELAQVDPKTLEETECLNLLESYNIDDLKYECE
jgi:hypothetical protein